jgi:3-dehydroquinate dehydratase-2
MKLLLLNGPNLGTLGRREPEIYGKQTLAEIEARIVARARELGAEVSCFQSNHEGTLIDRIEQDASAVDAIVINPGALSHYSHALADALRGCGKPVVEVHLSNVYRREAFRHQSVTAAAAIGIISGLGADGYLAAVEYLVRRTPAT